MGLYTAHYGNNLSLLISRENCSCKNVSFTISVALVESMQTKRVNESEHFDLICSKLQSPLLNSDYL